MPSSIFALFVDTLFFRSQSVQPLLWSGCPSHVLVSRVVGNHSVFGADSSVAMDSHPSETRVLVLSDAIPLPQDSAHPVVSTTP